MLEQNPTLEHDLFVARLLFFVFAYVLWSVLKIQCWLTVSTVRTRTSHIHAHKRQCGIRKNHT